MNQRGYSLVEIVVVLGIMATLLALATMNFQKQSYQRLLENQLRAMYSDLMTVRSQALFEKKVRAVRITGSTLEVYSTATTGVAPLQTRNLRYSVSLNNMPDPLLFTTRGFLDGVTDVEVCIDPAGNSGSVDSLVMSTTRIHMGKRNAASTCTKDNIVLK